MQTLIKCSIFFSTQNEIIVILGAKKLQNLYNINNLKEIIKKNNFNFTKSLGQNFIVNPEVCPKMAEECITEISPEQTGILEIGPGIGTLTECLAQKFKKVVAIEIDKKLIPILDENLSEFNNIEIINSDVLKTDLNKIIEEKFNTCENIVVCANLPYYITSEILMYLLENEYNFNRIVIMIQKEAAERICAPLGTRESGAISVAVRYFGNPEILFNVNKNSFIPVPKVDSSVIKININKNNSQKIKNKKLFFRLVKAGFSQRRKNLVNCFSKNLNIDKAEIIKILENNNINLNSRAENLKFEDWINLSNSVMIS